jgi:hypothetical protein
MIIRYLPLLAGFTVCAACAAEEPPAKRPPVREYDSVRPQQPSARNDSLPQTVHDALQADASKRSGVAAEQLTVVSAEKVTWTDGALGCPQPGRLYTQSIVPGYRVWMRAGQKMIVYHTNESGDQVVVCPSAGVRPAKPDAPIAE